MAATEKENRQSERFETDRPEAVFYIGYPKIRAARVANCSETGVYLETDSAIRPGSIIFIASSGDGRYFRAEVMWCRRLSRGKAACFGIGANYCDPAQA